MRKGTKKNIIHGILIIFVIIFALMASLIAAFRDLTVQSMIARSIAGELASKLETNVKIRTFYITEKMTVRMEDVVFDDLDGYPMFQIGILDAKFYPLLMRDDVRIKEVYMKDVLGRIVKYEGNNRINITELIALLSGEKKRESEGGDSKFSLHIDKFKLDNGHVIYWNQNKHKPEKLSMDYHHIDIDSIYGDITDLGIRSDSVFGNVHSLKGKDRCGLVLNYGRGNVLFCEKCLNIDSLILETGESRADLDLRFDYGSSSAYYTFEDSVYISGDIRQSTLKLSDLRYFAWVLDRMPDKFTFTGEYRGPVRDFTVSDFVAEFGNESYIDADVSFKGLPDFFETFIDVNIREMYSSYNDTKEFAIPIESKTVPIPEALAGLGKYSLTGSYQGLARDFRTQFQLTSEMGDVEANVFLNTSDESMYSLYIAANGLKLDGLLGTDDGAEATFAFGMEGGGLEPQDAEFTATLAIDSLYIYGNRYDTITAHGTFENKRFTFDTKVEHPYLDFDVLAWIDFKKDKPYYDITTNINNIDFVNLHLLDNDSVMRLSTNIRAGFCGDDIDNINGDIYIKDTKYFNGENYNMKLLYAGVNDLTGNKDVTIECDFFSFSAYGNIKTKTLLNSFKGTAQKYVNMPEWFADVKPDTEDQWFSLNLNLYDTKQLSKLFVPTLYVKNGTSIQANYNNMYANQGGATVTSPEIWFNGITFKNLVIQNSASQEMLTTNLMLNHIILRDSTEVNPDPIQLDSLQLHVICANNRVNGNLYWNDIMENNDPVDHNKAYIRSEFIPSDVTGGKLTIKSEYIHINDTMWYMDPNCCINFKRNETFIDSLILYTGSQKLAIQGAFPRRDCDTLEVRFNNFNVSNLDFVTAGNKLDFDGFVNGKFSISGLSEHMSFSSDIGVDKFYINNQEVGDVKLYTNCYDTESVMLDMSVINRYFNNVGDKSMQLFGFYYPRKKHDNLMIDMSFKDFKLETVSPFVSNIVTRMNGFACGSLHVAGSVNKPDLSGDVFLKNAGCRINYLNTYYTINDSIKLATGEIRFNNVAVNDTLGNTAYLNGAISHDHLKNFNFDLTLRCKDFLALNIPAEQADGFYGTAVADGYVKINGNVKDITMTINATTKNGTEIDVPLSSTSVIDNSFVIFVQKKVETDTVVETFVPEVVKDQNNFTMNLNTTVTRDAEMKIFLPQNMGQIDARGNGNLRIGLNNDDFELRGDYVIADGTFTFTFDMMKKVFSLREGGTLRWTGDPADADINIVGVLHTKSSLTSLGTVVADSSALTNNINVDCIIRLSDKLMNPTVNFGIELPNAKEDTRNIVFAVIDTTNQAVMAQQVFSLMMLGSFSYTAGSNLARFGTNAGYSVITGQLSSLLSQISDDFDVGINYTPNDQLTNEEIEVALSTQLFNDRLIIEGNFGVIRGNRSDADNANNIVGDVDLTYRLSKRWNLKAYNHTNVKNNYYYYSVENYSDFTQGAGISFSQSFDNLREVFGIHKRHKKKDMNNEPAPR